MLLDQATTALAGIGCGPPVINQARAQITIPVCDPVADLMAAVRTLDTAGIVPMDLGLRRPSLEPAVVIEEHGQGRNVSSGAMSPNWCCAR